MKINDIYSKSGGGGDDFGELQKLFVIMLMEMVYPIAIATVLGEIKHTGSPWTTRCWSPLTFQAAIKTQLFCRVVE